MAQKQNTAHTENNAYVKSPTQRQVGKGRNTVKSKCSILRRLNLDRPQSVTVPQFQHSNMKTECIDQAADKARTLAIQLEGINCNSVHQTKSLPPGVISTLDNVLISL